MIVMKFGGTSVADAAAITRLGDLTLARRAERPVVVVSALAGVTDALVRAAATEDDAARAAIVAQLAAKGLKQVDSGGDLWVAAHPRLSRETQVNTYNTGWGYGYGWYGYGGMATTTVTQIPVGTLLIDLVDAKKKELVWRGVASDTLNTDPNRTAEDREKKLRAVASEMFAGYPPKK